MPACGNGPAYVFFRGKILEDIMPKMKTNRGAAKRFKVTGTGKIVRNKAYSSHILTSKSTKRKRRLRKSALVDSSNMGHVRRLTPYL
jgi:large subunit ribosomal protein L35